MTEGHKHRELAVPPVLFDLLRMPLLWSEDYERLDASPYPWRPLDEDAFKRGERDQPYCLTALGILHRWTGLTITRKDEDDAAAND